MTLTTALDLISVEMTRLNERRSPIKPFPPVNIITDPVNNLFPGVTRSGVEKRSDYGLSGVEASVS